MKQIGYFRKRTALQRRKRGCLRLNLSRQLQSVHNDKDKENKKGKAEAFPFDLV